MDSVAAQWYKAGTFFTYGQYQIFYRTEGDGDPLLLLHGFPTSSLDWNKMWDALKEKYKLIALDFIGYGFSDKPSPYNYSIKDNADIAESLLASLGINNYHVIAHDVGDSVAQELLARHIDIDSQRSQIRSCCLLNGGLFPETHRPTTTQKLLLSPLGFVFSRMGSLKKFVAAFSILFPDVSRPTDAEMKSIYELILYNGGNKITHRLIRYIIDRRHNRERWVAALQNATCPLLLINGVEDPVSGRHMVQRYRELVLRSEVVEIDNCGHYPQLEYPGKVLESYFRFRNKRE
jgi:pimeloyl-ACP methyl ester carboxylesterase